MCQNKCYIIKKTRKFRVTCQIGHNQCLKNDLSFSFYFLEGGIALVGGESLTSDTFRTLSRDCLTVALVIVINYFFLPNNVPLTLLLFLEEIYVFFVELFIVPLILFEHYIELFVEILVFFKFPTLDFIDGCAYC